MGQTIGWRTVLVDPDGGSAAVDERPLAVVGSRPWATSALEHLDSRGLSKETLARVRVPQ
ncbi:MAG TPA: hypothetical protein VHY21_15960 [Pseudonocardiaceae bacterium]|jgi:hypothetical protein|nr:hypothetical protein [Pseudonocardiaceae bacterium]